MTIFTKRLESCLDKITLFEQGRYTESPEELRKEIDDCRRQASGLSFHLSEYMENEDKLTSGIQLLDLATQLDHSQSFQKRTPSTFEIVANPVFDFSKYLFWTAPSNMYHYLASSVTGRKWHQIDSTNQNHTKEVSLVSVLSRLFSYEKIKATSRFFPQSEKKNHLLKPQTLITSQRTSMQ